MRLQCKKCSAPFEVEYDDEGYPITDKLCYHCFEDAVEEAHFRMQERIQRANEY